MDSHPTTDSPTRPKLSTEGARQALADLASDIGEPDQNRAETVVGLLRAEDRTASLEACLHALYPGHSQEKALASFRGFRSRLAKAAARADQDEPVLQLQVDSRKRTPASRRLCWFVGQDRAQDQIRAVTNTSIENDSSVRGIPNRAMALPQVPQVLLWYDTSDTTCQKLAKSLTDDLHASRPLSKGLPGSPLPETFKVRSPDTILTGEVTAEAISRMAAESDCVVVLLTPKLLGSKNRDELGAIVKSIGKPKVLRVDARQIGARHDVDILAGCRQAAHKFDDKTGRHIAYTQLRGQDHRENFVIAVSTAIQELLSEPASPAECGSADDNELSHSKLKEMPAIHQDGACGPLVLSRAAQIAMASKGEWDTTQTPSGRECIAVDELMRWATTEEDKRLYCAVLGEYGIGKTTTLKAFARQLKQAVLAGETDRQPIFIDFRLRIPCLDSSEADGARPDLLTILDEAIAATIPPGTASRPTATEILQLVRENRAILIFDGLDEKLVHMTEATGRHFIRQLFLALPPWDKRDTGSQPDLGQPPISKDTQTLGRLVFSCRSSYFPTLTQQTNAFRARQQDDVRESDYLGLIILPFNEQQIRDYLARLGIEDIDGVMTLLESVHNLRDLAKRPYLLRLITNQLGSLEADLAQGGRVLGVSLYRNIVQQWLDRDHGKHRFAHEDKPILMQELAAAMWRESERTWPWGRVREWLRSRLAKDPRLELYLKSTDTGSAIEKLEEDFRTATFILRPDTEETNFRFAHTSMQEYFVAEWLFAAASREDPVALDLPNPSDETIHFFVQLVELSSPKEKAKALDTVSAALATASEATRTALKYRSLAVTHGYTPPPTGPIDASGLDLSGMRFQGAASQKPLNMVGAKLNGARLHKTVFRNVLLRNADFSGASTLQAEFHQADASGAIFSGSSKLTASRWNKSSLRGARGITEADWRAAQIVDTQFPANTDEFCAERSPFVVESGSTPLILNQAAPCFFHGHTNWVSDCSWSPDGTRVLSASGDRTLGVWDAATGQRLLALEGHTDSVNSCSWSPDGTRVLSASYDCTLGVWDAATGQRLLALEGHTRSVRGCSWSPDGTRVLSASDDNTLGVWDAATGQRLLALEGHTRSVRGCSWSPDGTRVLSASDDNTLGVWDAATGQRLLALEGHTRSVRGCSWSPDGTRVLSASVDNTLGVWDAATGQRLLALEGHTGWVSGCSWSPDGTRVLSASDDNTLGVWDAATGQRLLALEGHTRSVRGCSWSPDGTRVLSASDDNTLGVWDAATGQRLLALEGHTGWVSGCSWSPDGTRVLSASVDNTLGVWDAATGQRLLALEGHTGWVSGCSWSPDGTRVLSASDDRTLGVWDAATGQRLLALEGHTRSVRGCSWSPDGTRVLSASDDCTLGVWDAATGQRLLALEGHTGWVSGCSWSPDGTRVLSASVDNTLGVWDAATGQRLLALEGHTGWVSGCSWSPDGTRVLSASYDNTLGVWDAATGQRLLALEGHTDSVRGCSWSPDGTRVLSASYDNTLGVWDAATGQRLLALEGHTGSVRGCSWSPDGTRVLSASYDETLGVWDAVTGQRLRTTYTRSGAICVLDHRTGRFSYAEEGAWRVAGWRYFDVDLGYMRIRPLESFGPVGFTQAVP